LDTLLQDVRYCVRMLLKHPGFAIASVLTLALGIGANTTIFTLINGVLLRQLPVKMPEQVFSIWLVDASASTLPFSIPDFIDFKNQNHVLEDMAAYTDWSTNLTGSGEPERLQGDMVTTNMFQMLGVEAIAGRTFQPEDDNSDSTKAVVLSYGLWQRRFGGSFNVIGRKLILNDEPYTVVGVLPSEFSFPGLKVELWVPLDLKTHPSRAERLDNFFRVIARLQPGVTREQAQSDMNSIAHYLQQQYPKENRRKESAKLVGLKEEMVGDFRIALLALFGAVFLVLLIACANLANMSLARAISRHREMAVRIALGASRGRLVQQVLTESVVVALLGGGLGLLLAIWGTRMLISLSPTTLPRVQEVNVNWTALIFTLGISLLVGIAFGLAPALQVSKAYINEDLKGASKGTSEVGSRKFLRSLLVISEMALTLVLLISVGLFIKSFLRVQQVDLGFKSDNVLAVQLAFPKTKYTTCAAVKSFYNQLSPRVENLPGVRAVSVVSLLPLSGLRAGVTFTIDGKPPASPHEVPSAQYRMISSNYFRTLGISLMEGREFSDQDADGSRGVAIINETMARRFWPYEHPIGEHLRINDQNPTPREVEVVGVVSNVKQFMPDGEPTMDLYVPYSQIPEAVLPWAIRNMSLVVRTDPDPLTLATPIRREVEAIDSSVPATNARRVDDFISASIATRRFNLLLLMVFAAGALLLAVVGVYAVMSYSVVQRTREIGIRLALGAQRGDVLRLVLRQGMRMILVGELIGLIGAVVLTRVLSSLLFGISATDLSTFVSVSLVLAFIGLLACYLPARRATKVDPIMVLRLE
jgi:putative ABC transport system permease protein